MCTRCDFAGKKEDLETYLEEVSVFPYVNNKCLLPANPVVVGLGWGLERMVECTFGVYLSFAYCGF